MRTIGEYTIQTLTGEVKHSYVYSSLEQEIGKLLWALGVANKGFNYLHDTDKLEVEYGEEGDPAEVSIYIGGLTFERQEKGWVAFKAICYPATRWEPEDWDLADLVNEEGLNPYQIVDKVWTVLFNEAMQEAKREYIELKEDW